MLGSPLFSARASGLNKRNLITKKTFGLLVNEVESIDINDHRDLEKAKLYEKYL